jgi:hypothetical protein
MNCKQLEELIHDLCVAEICYLKAKQERVQAENELNLTVNWETINELRATDELPKISNQKQRDAFITDQINGYKEKENQKLVEFNRLQRIYENREFLEYKQMEE